MSNFGRGSKGGKDTLEARKAERLRTRYRRARRDRDAYRRFKAIQSLRGSCKNLPAPQRRILAHKAHLLHNQFARNIYPMSHQGWTECMAILHTTEQLYSFSQPKVHKAVTRAINYIFLPFYEVAISLRRRAVRLGVYAEMCKGKTKNFFPEGEALLRRIASKPATWFKKRVCKVKQILEEHLRATPARRRINDRESWDFSALATDAEIRENAPILLFESDFELNRIREQLAPVYLKQEREEQKAFEANRFSRERAEEAQKSIDSAPMRLAKILGISAEEYVAAYNKLQYGVEAARREEMNAPASISDCKNTVNSYLKANGSAPLYEAPKEQWQRPEEPRYENEGTQDKTPREIAEEFLANFGFLPAAMRVHLA